MGYEINTKQILTKWESELRERLSIIKNRGITPKLTIVRVDGGFDSELYVNNKVKKAKELGIDPLVISLDAGITQEELNAVLKHMKHPTILQLPIPKNLDANLALKHLNPMLDVDGLTIYQKGLLCDNDPSAMIPATASGVVRILKETTQISGSKVVIISRSDLIGKPLSKLILREDGYPVVLHSKIHGANIHAEMVSADIIVTGCGQRAIFDSLSFNKHRQVIIDCSMYKSDDMAGVGDVDKEDVLKYSDNMIASGYGHTGPATVLGLMNNVIKYYE